MSIIRLGKVSTDGPGEFRPAPMRATTVREWFPTKGQHHAVKALVSSPRDFGPLECRFLTRATRIGAANVRERCRPADQLLAVKPLASPGSAGRAARPTKGEPT